MAVSLLRNLGVDETIVQALRKSCGEDLEGLQIEKDDDDLKLLVKCTEGASQSPHVVTIHRFFEKKTFSQALDPESSKEHYNCRDEIVLLADDNSGKYNVKINGREMRLSDSLFQLLLRLAQELKKDNGGWVYVQDLITAEIIPSDGYYPFSRLRSAIAGYLLGKNPNDFIECNGRKQYRISTDPGNVLIQDGAVK